MPFDQFWKGRLYGGLGMLCLRLGLSRLADKLIRMEAEETNRVARQAARRTARE